MICADLAGIRVFATGGVGGVHRGGESSLDVSADLQELARTSVAVVCAGAKSILDIGRTLEMLETLGVPVVGYGTDQFPAFYTRSSGYGVDARVDSAEDLANLLKTKWALGLGGGVLVANPVPEAAAMPTAAIDAATEQALAEVGARGLQGKGGHAVFARARRRPDQWSQLGDEHRPRRKQRAGGGGAGYRPGRAGLRLTSSYGLR